MNKPEMQPKEVKEFTDDIIKHFLQTDKKFNVDEKESQDFNRRFRARFATVMNDFYEIDP